AGAGERGGELDAGEGAGLLVEAEGELEGAVDVAAGLAGEADHEMDERGDAGGPGLGGDAGDLGEVELLVDDPVDDALDAALGADAEGGEAALHGGEVAREDVIGAHSVRDLE